MSFSAEENRSWGCAHYCYSTEGKLLLRGRADMLAAAVVLDIAVPEEQILLLLAVASSLAAEQGAAYPWIYLPTTT